MLKALKDIFSPKGEIGGGAFILNYTILKLTVIIVNIIEFYYAPMLIPNSSNSINLFSIFGAVITTILTIFIIFNMKKRILNICKILLLSIFLSIIFAVGIDIFIFYIYYSPFGGLIGLLFSTVIIPVILAILPARGTNLKEYWIKFFKNPFTIIVISTGILIGLIYYVSNLKIESISKLTGKNSIELSINPLSNYNGMKKSDILKLRKQYVSSSIFSTQDYEPNKNVFEKIDDKKAWWGVDNIVCSSKSESAEDNKNGLSEESRFINNPNMLVGVLNAKQFKRTPERENFCKDKNLLLIPNSLTYDKEHKLLIAKYKGSENFTKVFNKNRVTFLLTGLNARDFGYNWVYANKTQNVFFLAQSVEMFDEMVNAKPVMFRDYIAVGQKCGVKGGCNNCSPLQPQLEFMISKFPAEITLSLWKKKPLYRIQPAEIYYKIIIE